MAFVEQESHIKETCQNKNKLEVVEVKGLNEI